MPGGGCLRRREMCDPTNEKISELKRIAGSGPLLLTVSPERNGSIEAIRFALAGVVAVATTVPPSVNNVMIAPASGDSRGS